MPTLDETKECYERAIKAHEHHYSNFNYWMNFYAIIIGALFVGYYTIKEDELLKTIITLIGFATTLAWLQSFRGYYHWIKQWINVVMFHEEQHIKAANLVENDKESNRVYSLYYESAEEKSHCSLTSRNISTQKMTLRLIFILLLSWLILLMRFPKAGGHTFIRQSRVKQYVNEQKIIPVILNSSYHSHTLSQLKNKIGNTPFKADGYTKNSQENYKADMANFYNRHIHILHNDSIKQQVNHLYQRNQKQEKNGNK